MGSSYTRPMPWRMAGTEKREKIRASRDDISLYSIADDIDGCVAAVDSDGFEAAEADASSSSDFSASLPGSFTFSSAAPTSHTTPSYRGRSWARRPPWWRATLRCDDGWPADATH